jgi:hypothetical protein
MRSPKFGRSVLTPTRLCMIAAAFTVLASSSSSTAWGQQGTPSVFDRVEEDWELVIDEPDPDNDAPQILHVLSPDAASTGDYAVLEVNHGTQPEYFSGGVQLQHWSGELCLQRRSRNPNNPLRIPNEKVKYTLVMAVKNGQLNFSVKDGSAESWAEFTDGLELSTPTAVTTLPGYTVSHSTQSAKIGFAAHRVQRLRLLEVRYYLDDDVVHRDTNVRQVHPPQAGS